MFVIELDYRLGQLRAELGFVESLVAEIADGRIDGYELWAQAHETGEAPSDRQVWRTST
jgi:hypothetical protein